MYQPMSASKSALSVAVLLAAVHLMWSVLVALGWAQAFLDFVFWAHMLNSPYIVQSFNMTAFVTLIVLTSVIGAVFGYLLAVIWNRMHRS